MKVNEKPGCYVDESAGSADDCNSRTIDFAQGFGFDPEPMPNEDGDFSQFNSEVADDAVSFLNDNNEMPYTYWTFEDNSLFCMADIESAKESCEFVSSKSEEYPPDGFLGEWLHINDHGNVTLYVREAGNTDREVWSVV